MRYTSLILISIIFFSSSLHGATKHEISTLILSVQTELNSIGNDFSERPYIPFDVYNEIVLFLISATIHQRDRNYDKAFFYAQMSSIKLNTLKTIIQVNQYKEKTQQLLQQKSESTTVKTIIKEKECTIDDIELPPIMKAHLEKKGTTFRVDLLDRNLFTYRTFKLTRNGKKRLDMIADAILAFPDSKIKVVGHTRWNDFRKHSRWKAKVVYSYLTSKGVDPTKSSYLGVGNRVVMDTPWGFRRVNRVEVIIFGIELNTKDKIKLIKKKK